ncbi:hypothetical protein LJR039_005058 [Pseudorhodoferax sp. LjRoot39]|uniref:hypothetical protein n=1 Tax=Pseudorhodoferax sp. LjRoot39 TaxID=3342328 RepID=UPI003ECF73D6
MPSHAASRSTRFALGLVAALALAACGGGGGDDDHAHEDYDIDTAGRLAIAESGSPTLRLHDLDSGAVVGSFTLANSPSAVYASPGGRYALALQRPQDVTQIVDGGIWQEDHGDHDHDYKQDPRLLTMRVDGPQPTHYDDRAGQAALFMDGRAATAQNASALLLTDAGIAAGQVSATLPLTAPMHGFAEPNGDHLVTSALVAGATSPTQVEIYRRQGSAYSFVQRLDAVCPGMHGSYTQGTTTVAGCSDGAMLVRPVASGGFAATRVTAPSGISTIAGHPELARFVGVGNSGTPSTTRFYDIDPATNAVTPIAIAGWGEGRLRRAHGFDREGRTLFVLDDQGTLYALQYGAGAWTTRATLTGAVPAMPAAAPFPAFAANGARDEVYLSDPSGKQLLVVDAAQLQVKQRVALGFTPSYLAWLGIAR